MLSAESSTRAVTPSGRISYARIDKKIDGVSHEKFEIPNLIELQLDSFAWFMEKGLRELFDEMTALCEKELKRSGEFVIPGMVKLVVQKRKARMGRNPATGEAIKIPAKTVVKARIAKQLKDAVLPRK